MEDVLSLINNIFQSPVLPESKYMFNKIFPKHVVPKYHFYCENCQVYVDDTSLITCSNCENQINYNTDKSSNFFITLPIDEQIEANIKRNFHNIMKSNESESNDLVDIKDGINYKRYDCLQNGRPITLSFNTDGINVFKSKSKGSLWPIQFVINELDPHVRFKPENIIVCGFWFGGNPVVDIFFR